MKSFSELLKIFREEEGIKKVDLAKEAGIDTGHLSRMENGQTKNPNKRTVLALASALRLHGDKTAKLLQSAGYEVDFESDEAQRELNISRMLKSPINKDPNIHHPTVKLVFNILDDKSLNLKTKIDIMKSIKDYADYLWKKAKKESDNG
ncbi:helix-turn-helix domain-containing protein [candidate division KSB1 bacterium]|nr:helix-turn-helix domain-containing protein [candidate division KSB1 bacterium]